MSFFNKLFGSHAETEDEARRKRLAPLAPTIANAMTFVPLQAAALAVNNGYDKGEVLNTRFFGGYIYGFFTYFEDRNHKDGELLRSQAFSALHGMYEGLYIFGVVEELLEAEDPQVRIGSVLGSQDGNRYFDAACRGERLQGLPIGLEHAFQEKIVRSEQKITDTKNPRP
jgi:hypothetical protein